VPNTRSSIRRQTSRHQTRCWVVLVSLIVAISTLPFLYYSEDAREHYIVLLTLVVIEEIVGCSVAWAWMRWSDKTISRYEVLGPIILTLIAAWIMALFLSLNEGAKNQLSDFIVLMSLAWTVFYVFLFIIAPQFAKSKGLVRSGAGMLTAALLFSVTMTLVLFSIYFDLTFLKRTYEGENPLYVIETTSAVFGAKSWLCGTLIPLIHKYHFFLFILSFVLVDLVIARYSSPAVKKKFRQLIVIVDVPMMIAALGTVCAMNYVNVSMLHYSLHDLNAYSNDFEALKTKFLDGELRDSFEAGAIAFQLVSGSMTAYFLENHKKVLEFWEWAPNFFRSTYLTVRPYFV
jgi:hypothetical protein